MRTVIIFCLCLFTFTVQAQDDVNYTYMDSLFQQLPEVLVKGERLLLLSNGHFGKNS